MRLVEIENFLAVAVAAQHSGLALAFKCPFQVEVRIHIVETQYRGLSGGGIFMLEIVILAVAEHHVARVEIMDTGGVVVAVEAAARVVGIISEELRAGEIQPVDALVETQHECVDANHQLMRGVVHKFLNTHPVAFLLWIA